MVQANLVSMSVEALLQLHDDIGNLLSQKASQLQNQLAALGMAAWQPRPRIRGADAARAR